MKLSEKDKEFLRRLRELSGDGSVWVERTFSTPLRFVLRGNYGAHIEQKFGLSRQGVRWRFWRLFNEIYVSAYETIVFIEKELGTQHRQDAVIIAHDRYLNRQRALIDLSFREANPYRGKDED